MLFIAFMMPVVCPLELLLTICRNFWRFLLISRRDVGCLVAAQWEWWCFAALPAGWELRPSRSANFRGPAFVSFRFTNVTRKITTMPLQVLVSFFISPLNSWRYKSSPVSSRVTHVRRQRRQRRHPACLEAWWKDASAKRYTASISSEKHQLPVESSSASE